ncbi:hypothetical protein PpBr36_01515 [Pyricularia pennisetigena]|uniref:hypothetical protein n=1 Tax=Pyricularia pennisetigena TaxID=1578925 RepID=UPI001151854E|nr:hypothetical protein PpBr36_01515 [Pyricularia pennisetigena]TLS29496.1 hypothetical protein PpBr36_01515 [Pyricularia pennisetigena]
MEGAGEEDRVVLGGDGNSLGNTLGRESIAKEENKDSDDDDSGDEGNSGSRGDCSFGVVAGELGSGSRQASSSCRCWSSGLWFAAAVVASAEVRRGGALTDDVAAVAPVAELSSPSWARSRSQARPQSNLMHTSFAKIRRAFGYRV